MKSKDLNRIAIKYEMTLFCHRRVGEINVNLCLECEYLEECLPSSVICSFPFPDEENYISLST